MLKALSVNLLSQERRDTAWDYLDLIDVESFNFFQQMKSQQYYKPPLFIKKILTYLALLFCAECYADEKLVIVLSDSVKVTIKF